LLVVVEGEKKSNQHNHRDLSILDRYIIVNTLLIIASIIIKYHG